MKKARVATLLIALTLALPLAAQEPHIGVGLSLSIPTEIGKSYTVQYKNNLTDPTWTDLVPPGSVSGTGGPLTITDPTPAGQPTRFYRIMVTP